MLKIMSIAVLILILIHILEIATPNLMTFASNDRKENNRVTFQNSLSTQVATISFNEVWAQGSKPGDAPISRIAVAIPPDQIMRAEARERFKAFTESVRPQNETLAILWDFAKSTESTE